MMRSFSPVPRRQMMFGVSAPSSLCSVRNPSLQPAWTNNSFSRAARSRLLSGMAFIRCRTTDFPAGANWSFCAKLTAHNAALNITTARPLPRIVRLSDTLSRRQTPLQLSSLERDPVLRSVHVSPGNIGVVGEDGEPLLGNGARIISFPILEHLKGKKIVGHGPYRIQVPCGWNQIRNVTARLPRAANEYRPHVARVSRPDLDRDSRRDLSIAIDQLHLA